MNRIVRRGSALIVAGVLAVVAVSVVLAQEDFLGGKLRAGESITIPAGEAIDGDLYLFAGTITMDGSVDGDLVAFGGTLQINGSVTGDVLTSGGTVTVAGTVNGDVRTAGGQLTVSGPIGEDVLAGGGQVTVSSSGSVGGDLIVSGGTVSVNGDVDGSILGRAGTYSRTGSLGGDEDVAVAPDDDEPVLAGNAVVDALRHYVVILLLGALALWLLPRALRAAEGTLRAKPLLSVGGGLATLFGYVILVVVIILLMILLAIAFGLARIGAVVAIELVAGLLTLGVVTFLFLLAVAFVGDIVVGLALGRLVAPGSEGNRWQELGLLAAGAAVVVIVTSLPFVGGWAKLAVVILGVGALAVAAFRTWRGTRPPPMASQPAPAAVEPTA
jgi:cytoskeletal protein CcmA (bactofilin family)